jgi:tRNA A58 N-methylase Trm61
MPFKTLDEKEIKRLNWLQQMRFDELVDVFEPPLQDGVPGRLERIVAAAEIRKGEIVLDVGTGTGILMPVIQKYRPGCIYA